MARRSTQRLKQKGVALAELAVGTAVVLAAAGYVAKATINSANEQVKAYDRELLENAQAAIETFAFINSRLPCPNQNAAGDTAGVENSSCPVGASGDFPYKTLGVTDVEKFKGIKYIVPSSGNTILTGREVNRTEFVELVGPDHTPKLQVLALTPNSTQQSDYFLDLCTGLYPKTAADNVAYELRLPVASGGTTQYQSFVRLRSTMWQNFNCSGLIAAARTHVNTAIAAEIMSKSAEDNIDYVDIDTGFAQWDLDTLYARTGFDGAKVIMGVADLAIAGVNNVSFTSTSLMLKSAQIIQFTAISVNEAQRAADLILKSILIDTYEKSLKLNKEQQELAARQKDTLVTYASEFKKNAYDSRFQGLGLPSTPAQGPAIPPNASAPSKPAQGPTISPNTSAP